MNVDRRTFLLGAAAAAAACAVPRESSTPLARAAQYLWAQQGGDGGFHSATYGLLRSGQSLTPFVLGALLRVPGDVLRAPDEAVDRALAFITAQTNADGALGRAGDSDDYPNYATALAVNAFATVKRSGWESAVAPMVAHLRAQQFSEANGWTPDHLAYGGWGMGGPIRRPPDAGHVDLSMTRFVLEALQASGVPASDPALTRALVFLGRAQNADGGFVFSPVMPALNKAGEEDGEFLSYGTTTADGLIALRAAGLADTDDRSRRARAWLEKNHTPDRVPGFPASDNPEDSWSTGLRFYYAAAVTQAVPGLAVSLPEPGEDGSYRNRNGRVKEDDPLIATAFAIHALASMA